jgi:hypothetical protein
VDLSPHKFMMIGDLGKHHRHRTVAIDGLLKMQTSRPQGGAGSTGPPRSRRRAQMELPLSLAGESGVQTDSRRAKTVS